MLKCREVVRDADLLLAEALPWQRRLAIRIHLLLCQHCRRYVCQLRALVRAIPAMHHKASEAQVEKIMDRVTSQADGRD